MGLGIILITCQSRWLRICPRSRISANLVLPAFGWACEMKDVMEILYISSATHWHLARNFGLKDCSGMASLTTIKQVAESSWSPGEHRNRLEMKADRSLVH